MQTEYARLRTRLFSASLPLDSDISETAAAFPSHRFLSNPAGQYAYIYLTRYVKSVAEHHFRLPFDAISVLDWGCAKGHVSKLFRDLQPGAIESCDVQLEKYDSAFGQQTPILQRFGISVTPLTHPWELPYSDTSFDVVVSFGVLEHVPNDRASLAEIERILKPAGLFFCFFLPARLSWTQKLARWRGDGYHDRLYTPQAIQDLVSPLRLKVMDQWYRQLLPKNSINYPAFRAFEQLDQLMTRHSPLRRFATNIEFVATKEA